MANRNEVTINIRINDDGLDRGLNQLRRLFGQIDGGMRGARDSVRGLNNEFGNVNSTIGSLQKSILGLGGIIAGGLGINSMIKTVADFEAQMDKVSAIGRIDVNTTEGQKAYKELEDAARLAGATTKFSAMESAQALEFMAMAGWDVQKSVEALPQMLNLSSATGLDLARTSDIATNVFSALRLEISQFPRLVDAMAFTTATANTNLEQLGESAKYAAPIFAAAGFEVEDLTSSIGLLANIGLQGSTSGTTLRMGILRLAAAPKLAGKAMDALGFSIADAQGNVKDFVPMITELAQKMSVLGQTEKLTAAKHIFGVEASTGMLELLNQTEALRNSSREVMKEYGVSLENADGTTRKAIDTINDLGNQLKGLTKTEQTKALKELFRVDNITQDTLDLLNSTDKFGTALGKQNELVLRATNRLAEYHDEQEKAKGTAEKMSKTMMDNLKGDWDILGSTVQEAFLIAGESIAPVLRDITQQVTDLVKAMYPLMGMVKPLLAIGSAFLAMNLAIGIINGITFAMTALQGATILTADLNLILQGRFWSWAASIKAADGAMAKLKLTMTGLAKFALGGFFLAFTAFEIGKYFYDEFAVVRAVVDGSVKSIQIGFEYLKAYLQNAFIFIGELFDNPMEAIKYAFSSLMIYLTKKLAGFLEIAQGLVSAFDFVPGLMEASNSLLGASTAMRNSAKFQEKSLLETNDVAKIINENNKATEDRVKILEQERDALIAKAVAEGNGADAVKKSLDAKKEAKKQLSIEELAEQQRLEDLEKANVKIVDAMEKANEALQMSVLSGKKQTIEFEAKLEFDDTDQAKELAQIQLMTEYYKDIIPLQHELAKATMSSAEAKEYDAKLNYGDVLGKQRAEIEKNVAVTKSLHKAIEDFQRTSLSQMDTIKLDVELELGDAGKNVAEIKILTKVNEGLVKTQHDLAKATMTVAQAKEYDLSLQYGAEYGKFFAQIEQGKEALAELTKSTQEFSVASLNAKEARVATLRLQYPEYLAKELALSEQITSARKDLTSAMLEYNKAGMSELQAKEYDLSQQYNESIAHSLTLIGSLTQAKGQLAEINDRVAKSEMTVWEARQFELAKKYPEIIAQYMAQLELLQSVQAKVVDLTRQLETASLGELEARKAQLSLEMPSYMANIIAQTEALVKFEGELANTTKELAQSTMSEYDARVANLSIKYPESLAKEYATLQTLVDARKELTTAVTAFNEVGLTEYELQQKRLSAKIGEALGTEISQIKLLTQVKTSLLQAETELNNLGLNAFELREKELQQNLGEHYGSMVASVKNLTDIRKEQLRLEEELAKANGDESLVRRLELEKQVPDAIADQIIQIEKLTSLRAAQVDAEKQANDMLLASNLTDKQREYVEVLKEVGVEVGKQVIQTRELAQARMEGTKIIADMQQEIATMGFSDIEKERFELLKQVAPEQQEIVNQLYNEKQALLENQKELEANRAKWQEIADSAGLYFEKFLDGEMTAREALTGFFDDLIKQQQKAMIEQAKEQFMSLVVGVESEPDDQQKVIDAVNASRDAIKSDIDKASQFVAENVKDSALELGRISSETIQHMTDSLSNSYEVNTQQLITDVQQTGEALASNVDQSITTLTNSTQSNITALVDGMKATFSQFSTNINQAIDSTAKALEEGIKQSVTALASTLDKTLNTLHSSITDNISRLSKAIAVSVSGMSNALKTMVETLGKSLSNISVSTGGYSGGMPSGGGEIPKGGLVDSSSMEEIRKKFNESLVSKTKWAIEKGITYSMKVRNLDMGSIDCSGWVEAITQEAFTLINKETKEAKVDKKAFRAVDDISHNIIDNIAKQTGFALKGKQVNMSNLKAGMMIGLDTGVKSWDKGRVKSGSQIDKNIDHIVQVIEKAGKLWVTESRGGKGVDTRPLADYLERFKNANLFAVDPLLMVKGIEKANIASEKFSEQLKESTGSASKLTKQLQDSSVAIKGSTEVQRKSSYTIKDSMKIVAKTAKDFGINVSDFMTMAQVESSFDYKNKAANSSARGLFQFTDIASTEYNLHGKQFDPFANAEAAAKMWNNNLKEMEKIMGKGNVNFGMQYMAHQQGLGGYKQILRASQGKQGLSTARQEAIMGNVQDIKRLMGISKQQLEAMGKAGVAGQQKMAQTFLEYWKKKGPEKREEAFAQIKKYAGDVFAIEQGQIKEATVITQQDIGSVQALQQSSIDVAKAQQEITNITQNTTKELEKLAVSGSDTTQAFNRIAKETPKIDLKPLNLEADITANLPNIENNLSKAVNDGLANADVAAAEKVTVDLSITTETLASGLGKSNIDSDLAEKIKQFSMMSFDETGQAIASKVSIEELDNRVANSIQSLALAEFNLTSEQVASGISNELKGNLDNRIVELVRNQAVYDLGYTAEDIAKGLSSDAIDKVDERIANILKQQAINELGLTQETIAQGLTDATKGKIDDRVAELLRSQVAFELKGTATQISELSKEELAQVDARVQKIMSGENISLKGTENAISKNVIDSTLLFDKKIAQNVTARAQAKLDFTEDAISKNLNHELTRLDKAIVEEIKQQSQLGLTQEEIDSGVFDDQVSKTMTESLRSFVMGSMELTQQDLANDPIKANEVEQRIAELMKAPSEVIEKSDEIVLNELRQAVSKGMGFTGTMEEISSLTVEALGEIDGNILDYLRQKAAIDLGLSEQALAGKLNDEALAKIDINVAQKLRAMLIEQMGFTEQQIADNVGGAADKIDENLAQLLSQVSPQLNQTAMQMAVDLAKAQGIALEEAIKQVTAQVGSMGGGGGLLGGIDNAFGWVKELSSTFSGEGIMGGIGEMFGGGGMLEGIGKTFTEGLFSKSGSIGSLFTESGAIGSVTSALGGFGNALGLGKSLLEGDFKGAILGAVGAVNPMIGAAASFAADFIGLGAQWVRESEWVRVSIRGTTEGLVGDFDKGFKEVKDAMIGGGERVGYEALDEATVKQLNEALGKTNEIISEVSQSLGFGNNSLLASFTDFTYHIEAFEDKGDEWFTKQMEQMAVNAIKHSVRAIKIPDPDATVSDMVAGDIANYIAQIVGEGSQSASEMTTTFSQEARQAMWDGVMRGLGEASKEERDRVREAVTDQLQGYVASLNEAFISGEMTTDEINSQLKSKAQELFSSIAGVSIPEGVAQDLADRITLQITDVMEFIKTGVSDFVVTDDIEFFQYFKDAVQEFDGTEEEITQFINSLLNLKDTFNEVGLSTAFINDSMVTALGGVEGFTEAMGSLTSNFLDSNEAYAFSDSLSAIEKAVAQTGMSLPSTRDEFSNLIRGLDATTEAGQETFKTLLQNVDSFDSFYAGIEWFEDSFNSMSKKTTASLQQYVDQVSEGFKELGIEVPKTRKEFYDLVSALDLTQDSDRQLYGQLISLAPAFDNLHSAFEGIREQFFSFQAGDLNLLDTIFNATDAQEAGQNFSNNFMASFYDQFIGGFMSIIEQTVFDSIVTPLMDSATMMAMDISEGGINAAMNMAEGGISGASNIVNGSVTAQTQMATGGATAGTLLTTSGQLTAEALAGVVAEVEQQLNIMTQVMGALSESGVMENVATAMADIGAKAFSSVTSMQAPMQTYKVATPDRFGWKDAMDAENKAKEEANNEAEKLAEEAAKKAEELQKTFEDWRKNITDFNTGLEGNELILHNLSQQYSGIFDTVGKSAQQLGQEWAQLSQSDLEQKAALAGVELNQLTDDMLQYINVIQDNTKAQSEFNQDIQGQLAEFGLQGIDLDIFNWEKEAADLRKQAQDAGGDLLAVEELIALKRQDIDKNYAKQIDDFKKGLSDETITLQLDGIDLELFNLDQWRADQIKQAEEIGADINDVNALYNLKRLKIEEDFNKQRIDYNKGIQSEIESLSLTSFDLEFLELDRWYQEQVTAAKEVNGDLSQLQQLYLLKHKQIMESQQKIVTDLQANFDSMATGLEGTALEIYKLEKEFNGLDVNTVALTTSSQDYAKWVQSLSYDDLVKESNKYGVTVEQLTSGLEKLGGIVEQTDSKVTDFNKAMSDQAKTFSTEGFTSDESTLLDISKLLPDFNVLGTALTVDLGELTAKLATANKEQLTEIAKSLGVPFDVFLEYMPKFISSSDNVQKSWINLKEGLQGLTKESGGTLATIKALGDQFPQFNLVSDSATLNIEDATNALLNMTEVELLAYLEATGKGLDETGKATLEYLNAVKTLQQGMENFKADMATTVMQLEGMSNAQISLQKLGGSFSQFGNTAIEVATNLSNMSNEAILEQSQLKNIEPDEFYKQANEYVNALKSNEDEIAKEREKALDDARKAQEESTKAHEKALDDAKKAQEEYAKAVEKANQDLEKQIRDLRSLFDDLSNGLKSVYDSIQSNIESFTPEDVLKENRTKRLDELRGTIGNLDLSQINISNEDFVRQVTKDFDELNNLIVADANDRIAAIESERDKARELHDQKIQQYEEEADRLKQLFDDAMGVVDSISDDIFEIEKSMGKAGTSALDLLQKERENYAASFGKTPQDRIDSANNLRGAIKEAMQFEIDEVERGYDQQVEIINQNFDKQKEALETARDNQIANIEAQAEAQREAAQRTHDAIIAQLDSQYEAQQAGIESEFEAKKSALEAQQAAAEELRDFLLNLKSEIKGVRDSLADDMLSLRREMGDPKASFKGMAEAMKRQISSGLEPTSENIAKVDEYRSLVLESMNEQIQKEQEKADLIAETQQSQLDNAQALRDFAKDLTGWLDDLALSDLSNLTNRERLLESERQYQETLKAARAGDETARSELTQKADQYLKEAQSFYASSGAYAGDTGIYETVRGQVSGLATTSTAQAAKIEKQVSIDETLTGKNTDAIKLIQQTALQELQRLDAIMAQMDMNVNARLATPAATPLPDEQFQAQIQAIDDQKNALLEQAKLQHEASIAAENARFELEQQMINQREALAKEEANARYEADLALAEEKYQAELEQAAIDKEEMITAIKEAYIEELKNISIQMTEASTTLALMYDYQRELAARSFAEDPWASKLSEVQFEALFELKNMRESVVASNDRLGETMQMSIQQLMATISDTAIIAGLNNDGITDLPSFDVGTDYVEKDMTANVHEGEMIIDPVTARQLRQYGINVTGTTSKTDTSRIEELLAILLEQVELSRQDSAQDTTAMVEAITELENTVTAPINRTLKNIESKGTKRR